MITVICVYNNENILSEYLLNSLKNQTIPYELILLDNRNGRYISAAQALNVGSKSAKGKYLMFVHQDVRLVSSTWLQNAEDMLKSLPNLGVAGVAGMSAVGNTNKDRGRNIIKHSVPSKEWSWGNAIEKPEIIQTLDECLAIIPKSVFNKLNFDEITCNDWHLYVVDYCLSCKKLNLNAYVIPLSIYHLANSKVNNSYYKSLKNLSNKHRDTYNKIFTTVGEWDTKKPIILMRVSHLSKCFLGLIFGD